MSPVTVREACGLATINKICAFLHIEAVNQKEFVPVPHVWPLQSWLRPFLLMPMSIFSPCAQHADRPIYAEP